MWVLPPTFNDGVGVHGCFNVPFQFKSNLSCGSTVVAIAGGWVGLYCVVLSTVSLALLAFGVFCTCCGLLHGRVDKPLNGDLRMTNDGAVQREYVYRQPVITMSHAHFIIY